MTGKPDEKTDLEKSRDIISQLKEMQHYSEANIEKLTEFWLLFDGKMKNRDMADKLELLLSQQNTFHDSLTSVVSDFEIECNRIENEMS
ncbi:MAG TPA: hypothetical protein VJ981_00455 [Gammaproteobacteria bacterium]|nr:hypothetical protein [Gammaproteobacteria bacterium]